jgi:integrase
MTWLFPGQRPECPLTQTTVWRICQQARAAAKLTKPVSPHTLRHCFASGRANGAIMLGAPTSGPATASRSAAPGVRRIMRPRGHPRRSGSLMTVYDRDAGVGEVPANLR